MKGFIHNSIRGEHKQGKTSNIYSVRYSYDKNFEKFTSDFNKLKPTCIVDFSPDLTSLHGQKNTAQSRP